MARKRLGEVLIEAGLITPDHLATGLRYSKQWGKRLGESLVQANLISEVKLAQALAQFLGVEMVSLRAIVVTAELLALVPEHIAARYLIFPYAVETLGKRKRLKLAMVDPLNQQAIGEVEFSTGMTVQPVLATLSDLNRAVRVHYRNEFAWNETNPVSATDAGPPPEVTEPGAIIQHPAVQQKAAAAPAPVPPPVPPPQAAATNAPLPAMAPGMDPRVVQQFQQFQMMQAQAATPGVPAGTMQNAPGGGWPIFANPSVPGTQPGALSAEEVQLQFNALLRVLIRKGLVAKDEYLAELRALQERQRGR